MYFVVDSAKALEALLSAVKADDSPARCGKYFVHFRSLLYLLWRSLQWQIF